MIPITVTAHLTSAPVVTGPIMLDAPLLYGIGVAMGTRAPSGLAKADEVYAAELPLARIDGPNGLWWWACSQVTPTGPEATAHQNRRPPLLEAAVWTSSRSMNVAAGPDKMRRAPYYYRPGMMTLTWTAVGDPERVARILARVPSIGARTSSGNGMVRRWEVTREGPPLDAYRSNVWLRHLPASVVEDLPEGVVASRRLMSLRTPYHDRRASVDCIQVQEAAWS